MVVDKNTEYYLIKSMGLTKTQISKMLPSEVEEHCNNVIKKRIAETNTYKSDDDKANAKRSKFV